MKRNRFFVCTILCGIVPALFFVSCKKDEDEQPAPNPGNGNPAASISYSFPLTDGSYWIYQEEQVDPLGNLVSSGAIDSTYVAGDTVIGANTYKKIINVQGSGSHYLPQVQLQLLRDSAGYLVSAYGGFLDYNNFTDTLAQGNLGGAVDYYYFMRHPDSTVVTSAGTFQTVDYEGHMYSTDPNYPHPSPRFIHQLYADGVGKILYTSYYYSSPNYVQRRMLRYHIQ